jgi:CDP-diglyceride synthetase
MWTSCNDLLLLGARVLYLALPVLAAAALHVVVIRHDLLRRLRVPIDLGRTYRGRRLLGDNKTWRGVLIMAAGASLAMASQQRCRVPVLELFDYGTVNGWLCGALLGAGFVLGELPNSFLKRCWGVPPGGQAKGPAYWPFTLLDQVDSIAGCALTLALVWPPPWRVVAAGVVLGGVAHVAFNLVFVRLGLKGRAL